MVFYIKILKNNIQRRKKIPEKSNDKTFQEIK